jgi:hypothetical protein
VSTSYSHRRVVIKHWGLVKVTNDYRSWHQLDSSARKKKKRVCIRGKRVGHVVMEEVMLPVTFVICDFIGVCSNI